MTINDTHDGFITDILFHTNILNSTIDQAQQYLFFIGFSKGTPWGIPRELLSGGRVAMTMEALRAFRTRTNRGFPTQNGQMSSSDLTIFTIKLGGHPATSMTRRPFNNAFHGNLNIADAIRGDVFDGHIGDVEWNLKGLAHRWTRFSGGWNVDMVNIRLPHLKKLAGYHCVSIASGVMRQYAPATLEAVSAPSDKRSSPLTLLGAAGESHGAICLHVGKATRRLRP